MTQSEILKAARKEFGWTLKQAAEEVGVGLRTWQFWEGEGDMYREAPEMVFRFLEIYRELKQLQGPFNWDRFNEEQARRSGAMLLRPERPSYGKKTEA